MAGLLAALVVLAVAGPGLGEAPFVGDDEALDAGFVATVLSGSWLFPVFAEEFLPPKPPLFYWLGALACSLLGGFSEAAVRLPSLLATALTASALVLGGARVVGARAAVVGGLLYGLFPRVHEQARTGRADATLTLLTTVVLLLVAGSRGPLSTPARAVLFVTLGLAVLAKGAVGLGLVVLVLGAWALSGRRREALRSLLDPVGLAVAVAIGASWFLLAAGHWGESFVEGHLVGENLRHLLGWTPGGRLHPGSLLRDLRPIPNLLVGSLPWVLPALLVLPVRRWRTADDGVTLLVLWVVAGLGLFVVAGRKSPTYLLPLDPAIALLAGRSVVSASASPWIRSRSATAVGLLVAVVTGAVLVGGIGVAPERWSAPIVETLAEAPVLVPALTAVALVGLGGAVAAFLGGARSGATLALGVAMAAGLVLQGRVEGAIARRVSLAPLGRDVARLAGPDRTVGALLLPLPAVSLYAGRSVPSIDPANPPRPPFLVIVPESFEADVPATWRTHELVRREARVFTKRVMGIGLLEVSAIEPSSDPSVGAPRAPLGKAPRTWIGGRP